MSLDGVVRTAGADRRGGLQDEARDRGPEPSRPHGRRADQRRRLRHRLVWLGRRPCRLSQRGAGVGGHEPARAGGAHRVAAVPRARAGGDRLAGAADQLPSLPARAVAVRPQRLHRGLPSAQARLDAGDRPRAVRGGPRLNRYRGRLLPRSHVRARGGPDLGTGADCRPDRGDRRPPRRGRPGAGQLRYLGRHQPVGRALRDQWAPALAVRLGGRGLGPPPASRRRARPAPEPRRPGDRVRAVLGSAGGLARDRAGDRSDRAPWRRAGTPAVPTPGPRT